MANIVLTNTQIIVGSFDTTGFAGTVNVSPVEAIVQQATTFGSGGYVVSVGGLKQAGLEVDGFADYTTATGITQNLIGPANLGQQNAATVNPTGGATVGDPAFFLRGIINKAVPVDGSVGEVGKFQLGMTADAAMVGGYVGAPLAARTTTFTGAAVTMTGPIAGQKLYAALFVTGAGTTLVAKVQSAPLSNFASPTDRITFSSTSATGWQWATPVAGAITDGFWRVTATIGAGTFTYAVVFGVAA